MSAQTAAAGSELWRTNIRRLTRVAVIANGVGGLLVFLLLSFLIPFAPEGAQDDIPLNAAVGAVYLTVALVLGSRFGMRASAPVQRWLESGRPPTAEERRVALGQAFRFAAISGLFWAIAAILFTLLNLPDSGWAALVVGGAILLGGETTCAIGYLLAERITRPVTALALAGGAPPPDRCGAPGVAGRLTTAWSLGTGVPLLGISVIAVASLFDDGRDAGLVAAAILFLAAIGMGVGMLAISMAARSVAEPLAAVRRAIAQIEEGQLDVVVPVDDGSEVGLLEAGFNRMTAGLRERERLRDLFGRHVGREVASAALENDGEIELGGEVREIAVIFVDMIGSTRLALERSPAEVVTLLNTFFCLVVEVVEEHGGWVNKFEGDAALCVFGAPTPSAAPAGDALRAARRLRERVARELSGDASIGVSAGPAVAGNVGARERFEYTVIGDAVNEASRLCELAKQRPGRLLASDAVLERAERDEVDRWEVRERVVLRGRDRPTGVAEPRTETGSPDSRRPATLTPAVGS
jgi:adenylate cyclase